jgi:hypothetical protein
VTTWNRPDRPRPRPRRPGQDHAMQAGRGPAGGASALRTERRRRIEDPAATYLPGLVTARRIPASRSRFHWQVAGQAGNALKHWQRAESEGWRGNAHSALDQKIGRDTETRSSRSRQSRWAEGPREGSNGEFPARAAGVGASGLRVEVRKVGSCYVTCYTTGGVLYDIFLLYNTLYALVV